MSWIHKSKKIGPVPSKDMQTPRPHPHTFSFDPIFMEDAQSYEKIFPIFIFQVIMKNSSKIGMIFSTKMTIT